MKIGIITFHFVSNQGAVLQCFALQNFLEKNGHEVSIIDYRPLYHTVRYDNFRNPFRYSIWFWKRTSKKKNFLRLYGTILAFARSTVANITQPDRAVNASFDKFVKKHLHLTKKYKSIEELQTDPPKLDAYISGSDQLWNPELLDQAYDPAYFLNFGDKGIPRITYAVSMGIVQESKELKILKDYCRSLTAVSLREYDKEVIEAVGRDVHICIDPALLLDASDYAELECQNAESRPYIFVYGFENSDSLHKAVEIAKEKYQCRVINGSPHRITLEESDNLRDYGPDMFLSLIKDAQCVVTNSFHGTVFSIIYKKEFITVVHSTRGGRMTSLLYHLKLTRRLWGSTDFDFSGDLDFISVNDRLNELRKYSVDYLFKALDGKKGESIPHMPEEYVIPQVNFSTTKESTRYHNRELDKSGKELPELFTDKTNCCGCTACFATCPVEAITMEPDSEGFLYPTIDAVKCIRCYRCLSVCAFKVDQEAKEYYQR